MFGVTVTGLAASAARQVPGVGGAAVTVLTNHVRETDALTAVTMAMTVTW